MEYKELNFNNMDEYLDIQIKEIELMKKFGINNRHNRLHEEIRDINDNNNLSNMAKNHEKKDAENYFGKLEETVSIIDERVESLVAKCIIILNGKENELKLKINNLDLSENDFDDVSCYNSYVKKIHKLKGEVSIDTIDISKTITDISILKKVEEYIESEDFSYEKLPEITEELLSLAKNYPTNEKIHDLNSQLKIKSSKIIDEKNRKLQDEKSCIFILPLEKKIFYESMDVQKYVEEMSENDFDSKIFNDKLSKISSDEQKMLEILDKLKEDSEEYGNIKEKLENLNNERRKLTEKLNTRKELFKDRFLEIKEQIKVCKENEEELSGVKKNIEYLDSICISFNNSKQSTNKKDINENEIKVTGIDKEKSVTSDDVVSINSIEEAIKFINNILNKNEKLTSNDYLNINKSVNLHKEKNKKIPPKQREKLIEVVNNDINNSVTKNDLIQEKDNIIKIMDKIGKNTSIFNFSSEEMYEALFLYDDRNQMPCVLEGFVFQTDKNKLALLIEEYDNRKQSGKLSERDKEYFERFIINPIVASMIKEYISDMYIGTRILKIIKKDTKDTYKLLNLAVSNLHKDEEPNLNSNPVFGEVYNEKEIVVKSALKGMEEKNEKNIGKIEQNIE